MSVTAEMGALGEAMVARYLKGEGYIIVRRNYKGKYGEIDIVAEKGEYILFVEVKTREKNSPISPQSAVSIAKMRRIALTAREYLAKLRVNISYRYDVAEVVYEIDENGEFKTSLNYIKNAFGEEVLKDNIVF